jgi:ABC-type uncharacterized transport system auxiliary subunit
VLPREIFTRELRRKQERGEMKYPTAWTGGYPAGSVKDTKTAYVARIRDGKGESSSSFNKKKYGEEQAKVLAREWQKTESDKRQLTSNRIRYVDEGTVEIEIGKGKVLIADAKNLKLLQSRKLICVPYNRSGKYIAVYWISMKARSYAVIKNLIYPGRIKYKNKNPLDLRESNIYRLPAKNDIDSLASEEENIDKQYEWYCLYRQGQYDKLPRNTWCLGKPAGSLKVENRNVQVALLYGGRSHYKRIKYGSEDELTDAKKRALRWQVETSYKLGMTRNLIRIVDDDTIEVKISKGKIMKTDYNLLAFVQKTTVFSVSTGYAACRVNGERLQFHNYVAVGQRSYVDHIDRDRLNNKKSNLRVVNAGENMRNRGAKTNTMGIVKYEPGSYIATITHDGVRKSKTFYPSYAGRQVAKQLSLIYRMKLLEEVNSTNGLGHMHKSWREGADVEYTVRAELEIFKLEITIAEVMVDILFDIEPHMEELEFTKKDLYLHTRYIEQQLTYMGDCRERIDNLKRKLAEQDTS